MAVLIPIVPRATSGWYLVIPLIVAGSGLGLLVSQLNNYTLSPISDERVSEAAGVNSAAGSFGLSFGLAFAGAIMLATLSFSFTHLAEESTVLRPAQQQQVAKALEHDAEVMSNTQLEAAARPPTRADPGRDHPHQHRGAAPRPSGGAAHPAPRRPHRAVQLVPDDAPTRPQAIRSSRGNGARLISRGAIIPLAEVVGEPCPEKRPALAGLSQCARQESNLRPFAPELAATFAACRRPLPKSRS